MSDTNNMATNASRKGYPETYYPNTEVLGENEMRIVALGTGRPFLRRSQANASWLIELGNGDKFVFDYGFGSQMNFTALEMPYSDVKAWFATHLHTDHVGDFAQVWVGSWAGGRLEPLEMYGPSGTEPKYGFRHFAEKQMESYAWDTDTRVGALPAIGAKINIHEFDYSKTHVIYENNGVTISSFPAVHLFDGAVSFKLEWKGLTFVYSGDTTPSQFFIDNAKGADVVVHETFNTIEQLMDSETYAQVDQLFRNQGDGSFSEVSALSGNYFSQPYVGRSCVSSDYDNDGDVDLLISNSNQSAFLLRNEIGNQQNWILIQLEESSYQNH